MIYEIQRWLAFGALGATVLLFVVALTWHQVRDTWTRARPFSRIVALVAVCLATLYGGSKSKISFDGGIKQNALQQSSVSNSTVKVYWQRDTSGGVYVPTDAAVYIDYRLSTDTNGVWVLLAETTVGAWGWSGTVANATNYDYNVWAYYIPPEPVHTNGVWVYKTLRDRSDVNPIPLRARIEVNGKAIATPKEKRKDNP